MILLKQTKSICPICKRVLDAGLYERNGQVFIERDCPKHGHFSYLYWDDADMWRRYESYDYQGSGVTNPQIEKDTSSCPFDCGLCSNHASTTLLANIDLTNRCNLNCDFCFANARACGYVYEPSFEQIEQMLIILRNQKPNPVPAVQFAGGEPTLRSDLLDIIRMAKTMGFKQIQMATNGLILSQDSEFAMNLKKSGLSTVYLHFDGISPETNTKLIHDKKAIEHCRQANLGVVLVPTIIKTVNDHEVGAIVQFAADNIGVVRGVNFQPVSFTGAANPEAITRNRITIPELIHRIEDQTDQRLKADDFYPIPCMIPISDFFKAYNRREPIKFTAHQHCGAATYAFVSEGILIPITRIVDVDSFFETLENLAEHLEKSNNQLTKHVVTFSGIRELYKTMKKDERVPVDLRKLFRTILLTQSFKAIGDFHRNALFIGMMHFMDNYNYDINRVNRCCIHYATPDGTLIPFCTYNSGPVFREKVWQKYAQSMDTKSAIQ